MYVFVCAYRQARNTTAVVFRAKAGWRACVLIGQDGQRAAERLFCLSKGCMILYYRKYRTLHTTTIYTLPASYAVSVCLLGVADGLGNGGGGEGFDGLKRRDCGW